jgi:hypothetical protein
MDVTPRLYQLRPERRAEMLGGRLINRQPWLLEHHTVL